MAFQTIAVATDLSPRADRAVARAFRMAARLGAELHLYTVIDSDLPDQMGAQLALQTEAALTRFAEAQKDASNIQWTAHILHGTPDSALVEAINAQGAEVLVVGLHRTRPLMDLIRETTMERLIRHVTCPVLIVTNAADHDYANILCALDFSPASTRAVATGFALLPKANLRAFNAVHVPYSGMIAGPGIPGDIPPPPDPGPFLAEARRAAKQWKSSTPLMGAMEIDIIQGSVRVALHKAMEEHPADLVVMGSHGRALPVPWLVGSVTCDLMRSPPTDLLIVPPAPTLNQKHFDKDNDA